MYNWTSMGSNLLALQSIEAPYRRAVVRRWGWAPLKMAPGSCWRCAMLGALGCCGLDRCLVFTPLRVGWPPTPQVYFGPSEGLRVVWNPPRGGFPSDAFPPRGGFPSEGIFTFPPWGLPKLRIFTFPPRGGSPSQGIFTFPPRGGSPS